MKKKISNTEKVLNVLSDLIDITTRSADAFFLSAGSARILARNLHMNNKQFHSAFQSLGRRGYIKKINEDQFLITPKSQLKIRIAKIENANWPEDKWDGNWRLIAFDIPETKRRERNIFRSLVKRKGFVGIQGSVFIAPFADFSELAKLRKDLKIEEYVSFFKAQSVETDDDSRLRERFDLN